ncbi:MAG: hypothetical protein KBD53_04560 [Candidatus Omnitrophica bacterium]|nr:hypothetical protein [Candidatus Omnitrophota bacterium]
MNIPDLIENDKNLIRRYLIWCYKTTKEDLDRIDRYFTQNIVDDFILEGLVKTKEYQLSSDEDYKNLIRNFEQYKIEKFRKAEERKFLDEKKNILKPQYIYLQNRLRSIEQAAIHFLGEDDLMKIIELYELEMTQRILTAREHT